MKMLVATHKALVLVDEGRQTVLHSGQGVYYGITWSEEVLFVVARSNEPSRMLAFDKTMYPIEPPPFVHLGVPEDGPHQALWHNGKLYVTNTQENRVEVWDGEDVSFIAWGAVGGDIDHINSIWHDPTEDVFWVAEHRKQKRPKRFRKFSLALDYRKCETIEIDLGCLSDGPTHTGVHNVYVGDGFLYTLGPSQVVKHSLSMNVSHAYRLEGVEPYKHYLRGLAYDGEHFYVGVSNARPREERGWGGSSILKVSDNLEVGDRIDLSSEFGQVMEIRLIDKWDLAHNGLRCPLELAHA